MARVLWLLILQKHLQFHLLLMQLLRRRQVEVVDDVREFRNILDIRHAVLRLTLSSLGCVTVLVLRGGRISLLLREIVGVHVLHACQRILLLIVRGHVSRPSLIEAARALKSFMVDSLLLRMLVLSLACAILHQLVLVPQIDHLLLFLPLGVLACARLRRPRIDERLLEIH